MEDLGTEALYLNACLRRNRRNNLPDGKLEIDFQCLSDIIERFIFVFRCDRKKDLPCILPQFGCSLYAHIMEKICKVQKVLLTRDFNCFGEVELYLIRRRSLRSSIGWYELW